MAAQVGILRRLASLKNGRPNRHGFDGTNAWNIDIEGACGEMAVAKVLGVFWDGSVDTFSANDLPNLQVRTSPDVNDRLIVRPGDSDTGRWCLVTGAFPDYVVHGWISGADAKRPEWSRDYNGRPPAYFVPQQALLPLSDLT